MFSLSFGERVMPGNMQQAVFDCGCCVVLVDCDCPTPSVLQMEMYMVNGFDIRKTFTLTYDWYEGTADPNNWADYQTDPDLTGPGDPPILGIYGWVGGFFDPDDPDTYVTALLTCQPDDPPNQTRKRFRWYTGITVPADAGFGEPNTINLTLQGSWLSTDPDSCCNPWIHDFDWTGGQTSGVLMADLNLKNDPFCICTLQTPVCCEDCCAEPLCGGEDGPMGDPPVSAPMTLNLRIENIFGASVSGIPAGYDETITINYCEKLFSWGLNIRTYEGVWHNTLCFWEDGVEYQITFIFNALLSGSFYVDIKSAYKVGTGSDYSASCTEESYQNGDDLLDLFPISSGCSPVSYTARLGGILGFEWLKVTVSE